METTTTAQPLRVLTPAELEELPFEEDMPFSPGDTTTSSREEAERRAWIGVMERAEIPPRFQPAHLLRNCGGWSEDPDRADAYAVAVAFADRGSVEERSRDRYALFLTGEFGRGKTWLASAVFKNLLAKSAGKVGMWRTFHWFVREVQATYHTSSSTRSDQVIRSYQKTPLLLLDDVGDLDRGRETEDRSRLLYEVLDYRNNYLLPTIITTNLLPSEMEDQFGARTFQRILEMSAFVTMAGENLREVAA